MGDLRAPLQDDYPVEARANWTGLLPDTLGGGPPPLPAEALDSIVRFDASLGRCQNLDESLRAAVGPGLRSFGARAAVIALLGYRVRLEHVHGSPGCEQLAAQCAGLPLDSPSPLAEVTRTGRAIRIKTSRQWIRRLE